MTPMINTPMPTATDIFWNSRRSAATRLAETCEVLREHRARRTLLTPVQELGTVAHKVLGDISNVLELVRHGESELGRLKESKRWFEGEVLGCRVAVIEYELCSRSNGSYWSRFKVSREDWGVPIT